MCKIIFVAFWYSNQAFGILWAYSPLELGVGAFDDSGYELFGECFGRWKHIYFEDARISKWQWNWDILVNGGY